VKILACAGAGWRVRHVKYGFTLIVAAFYADVTRSWPIHALNFNAEGAKYVQKFLIPL
jgi:hypothetical protein